MTRVKSTIETDVKISNVEGACRGFFIVKIALKG